MFISLIIIIGILSIYTDIFEKKIKNIHLLFIGITAINVYTALIYLGYLKFTLSLLLNPIIALLIGFIFYTNKLWGAGDGKLFFVFSLLTPINRNTPLIPFSCFTIFINTFLIGFLITIFSAVQIIRLHKNRIFKNLFTGKTLFSYFKTFLISFCLLWITFPLLNFFSLNKSIFSSFLIIYSIFLFFYKTLKKVNNKVFFLLLFIGLLLRLKFIPAASSLFQIFTYLKLWIIYSFFFFFFLEIIKIIEKEKQRTPFAIFLFAGTLLTYTDFLSFTFNLSRKLLSCTH